MLGMSQHLQCRPHHGIVQQLPVDQLPPHYHRQTEQQQKKQSEEQRPYEKRSHPRAPRNTLSLPESFPQPRHCQAIGVFTRKQTGWNVFKKLTPAILRRLLVNDLDYQGIEVLCHARACKGTRCKGEDEHQGEVRRPHPSAPPKASHKRIQEDH